jgi:hypothetical protein
MSSTKLRTMQRFWVLAVIIILVSGCASTINYKNIQEDFNKAVQADNIQSYDPQMLGTLTTTYQQNYEDIIQRLNDPYIQSIDPRLKMNAHTMKAISQWRTGKLDEARQTVALAQAQSEAVAGPRDKMVLLILPGLIADQELTKKFRLVRKLSGEDYQKYYEKEYYKAVSSLKEAIKQIPVELPENMVNYVHYQRWRVLTNWKIVIASIVGLNQRKVAIDRAADLLKTTSLDDEITKEKDSIPQTDDLGRLMNSLMLPPLPKEVKPPKPGETKPTEPKP